MFAHWTGITISFSFYLLFSYIQAYRGACMISLYNVQPVICFLLWYSFFYRLKYLLSVGRAFAKKVRDTKLSMLLLQILCRNRITFQIKNEQNCVILLWRIVLSAHYMLYAIYFHFDRIWYISWWYRWRLLFEDYLSYCFGNPFVSIVSSLHLHISSIRVDYIWSYYAV